VTAGSRPWRRRDRTDGFPAVAERLRAEGLDPNDGIGGLAPWEGPAADRVRELLGTDAEAFRAWRKSRLLD
jgi:hypothetical protein